MLSTRPVYRRQQLERVLAPRSVAVVGASPRAGSFGQRLLANLAGFDGDVYPVNAKYGDIEGQRCYPSLADLPRSPDCVVITTGRELVEPLVEEAAGVRAGGVLVFASGYSETGHPERAADQQRLSRIARERDLRVLGPNMLGYVNYLRRAVVTFSGYPESRGPAAGSVGIASQSGALSQALAQAMERGASVSHAYSAGNQCDVDVADLVAFLAEEESCRAIACVLEGLADPGRLVEAAELAWRMNKPLLVHKIATGQEGAAAAMSHTGSLAGSNEAYKAAFERAGIVAIDDFEALMESAAFFAKATKLTARGVAVCATSGGAAIMAADKAEARGVPLPQPQAGTLAVLKEHVPDFGSARNPCDVTAQVMNNSESLAACAEALMSDPSYGAVVLPQPVAYAPTVERIAVFGALASKYGKITCNVLVSEWLQGPATREAEAHPHVALFRSMDRCFRTLAAWHQREDLIVSRRGAVGQRLSAPGSKEAARKLVDAAPQDTLTEREAKSVLAAYGIPVVGERLVGSAAQAVEAAVALGMPVVLKVESPDLPHKTEAGVIRLNLKTAQEVTAAYEAVMQNAAKVRPQPRINGVLVQPMVPQGLEIMLGARTDPQFGALVVVSLGGVFVELMKDSQVALAPVHPQEALAMLHRLRGAAALKGFRGAAGVDEQRLAEVVARFSELAADQQERVTEIDVNPLICSHDRIVAVDALMVRGAPAAH